MSNIVITIGREYGSGGKYIGKEVSKKLGINFFDNELLQKTYEKNGCNYSKLQQYDEVKRNSILKALDLLSMKNYDSVLEDDACQLLISDTIKEIAESESCVIIGRNANKILKDRNNVINIFIYSNDREFKINRKMKLENLSYNEAEKRLVYIDRQRRKYYEYLNKNSKWGNRTDYDFCIDSSILGVDGTVELIVNIYNSYMKEKERQ